MPPTIIVACYRRPDPVPAEHAITWEHRLVFSFDEHRQVSEYLQKTVPELLGFTLIGIHTCQLEMVLRP